MNSVSEVEVGGARDCRRERFRRDGCGCPVPRLVIRPGDVEVHHGGLAQPRLEHDGAERRIEPASVEHHPPILREGERLGATRVGAPWHHRPPDGGARLVDGSGVVRPELEILRQRRRGQHAQGRGAQDRIAPLAET
jgi:hypothetical protein